MFFSIAETIAKTELNKAIPWHELFRILVDWHYKFEVQYRDDQCEVFGWHTTMASGGPEYYTIHNGLVFCRDNGYVPQSIRASPIIYIVATFKCQVGCALHINLHEIQILITLLDHKQFNHTWQTKYTSTLYHSSLIICHYSGMHLSPSPIHDFP